jgi:hypothetical protein
MATKKVFVDTAEDYELTIYLNRGDNISFVLKSNWRENEDIFALTKEDVSELIKDLQNLIK